jgi:hypothetical protein
VKDCKTVFPSLANRTHLMSQSAKAEEGLGGLHLLSSPLQLAKQRSRYWPDSGV